MRASSPVIDDENGSAKASQSQREAKVVCVGNYERNDRIEWITS